MKPPSIQSLLLVFALLAPWLRAQDAPAKIREIEQKVLLKQYQEAVHSLIGSAREAEDGATGNTADILGKRLQWLAVVGGQVEEGDKKAAANREDMTESAGVLNDLAWNMVTSRDAGARHPDIALKLADIAIELGDGNIDLKPKMLDTKARALFLLGKRDEAIAEQEKAAAAASVAAGKAGFEATLAAYRRNELPGASLPAPVREPFSTAEAALASKDLRSRTDEIFALQKRIEDAEKENSGSPKIEIDQVKEELTRQKDALAKLTELKDPASQRGGSGGATYILGKLRSIVIPTVEFEDATLEEAVDFLRKRSIELDTAEPDPARKGVNMVVRLPAEKPGTASGEKSGEAEAVRIKSLRLRNVPLSEALRYVCDATRFRYKVDDFAITLVSPDAPEDLFNRTFAVPPDFGSSLVPIQDLLKMCGINFREGASATLLPSGVLVVVNTPTELDKIEQLIEAASRARTNGEAQNRLVPAELAPPAVQPVER